jgi:hypothetical protein
MLIRHYAKFIPDDTPLLAGIVGQQLGLDLEHFDEELGLLWACDALRFVKNNKNNDLCGGEGGIRTLERFPVTHFPGVRLRPLGHLTIRARIIP